MKKVILLGLAVLLVISVTVSCKKKKDGVDRCGEIEIKVATIPASGTVDPPAPGPTFPLVVNITEGMPSSGVTITVSARQDGGSSTPYFTETRDNVTMSSNSFTITNTPTGTTCIVDITVTSKTCNTNQWKGSYRYAGK